MIVLRVVLEYFVLFVVFEGSHEVVDFEVFAPLFAVHKPIECQSGGPIPNLTGPWLRTSA